MKVLFDQNVPRPLQHFLQGHDIERADQLGWSELKNGELLAAAETSGFDVVLTGDRKVRAEQNMEGRRIAIICMSDNHWPIVKDHVAAIEIAVAAARPGTITEVDCGKFKPRRSQRPSSGSASNI